MDVAIAPQVMLISQQVQLAAIKHIWSGHVPLFFAGKPALLFEKEQKGLVLSFGAKERTKESIHPLQGLPLYGEDAIASGGKPPSGKVLVWLAEPVPLRGEP